MPKKKTLTGRRVFALFLAYLLLCLSGGVVSAAMLMPAVVGTNKAASSMMPALKVEGIDFDVTSLPQKSRLFASDGKTVIATFYAQNRTVVPLKKISKPMQQAVVAREDRRFFEHSGVDVQGVIRAFIQTFIKKGATQGGSSLTQQYVKNVLMDTAREKDDPIAEYHASEETIARKLREMLIAVQMEKKYTKPEILQGYLNIAQFGGNNLFGVETAARRYFNTSAADLNVVQAATIAAITKNPSQYDPSVPENQEEAQKQRNIVLDLMLQEHYISQKEHDEARAMPIQGTLNIQDDVNVGCQAAGDAAFFCDYASKQVLNSKEFGKTRADRQKLLNEGGLDIYTTMDITANNNAMATARNAIPVDDPSGLEVAIGAIKPGTGEVLGFGLNRIYDATDAAKADPTRTAINYAVDEKDGGGQGWQIGSSWKPINMVAWMQAGKSITQPLRTSTRYEVSTFSTNCPRFTGSGSWNVNNAYGTTVNPESPLQALVMSHNTTQASMTQQIGLCAVADAAKTLGYHNSPLGQEDVYSTNSFQAPMIIGTAPASPLTMANVYATLAADGVECTPIALKKVVDKSGRNLKVPSANCHQAIPKEIAQTTAYAMNQGVVRGVASTAQLPNGFKTFAKTGTNEDTYITTGGFVPHQIAAFLAIGNAEFQVSLNGKTINGVTRGDWGSETLAAPTWRNFVGSYIEATGIPSDTAYGVADPRYMGSGISPQPNPQQPQQQGPQR
ncbi:carboxypeptidase [Bifidobacterium aemilianum]|uniref:Carboxypeptidase n=1 Tax=Bifidobacterium aemilianum TaxID=2493120 RepID=A0A366K846_9BIFI|nr:transglycosylase domain-containing protein [Bifidobacterium aemilianum]RBP97487.1 carboxypeptidase [Bifidobacterium aemilianum]